MKYNPDIHHRRSIRLKGYDYSQAGFYFITICTQNRLCLFGEIKNGEMVLNEYGRIAGKCLLAIPDHYPHVKLNQFVVMPNHIHCIIEITVGANNYSPLPTRSPRFQPMHGTKLNTTIPRSAPSENSGIIRDTLLPKLMSGEVRVKI